MSNGSRVLRRGFYEVLTSSPLHHYNLYIMHFNIATTLAALLLVRTGRIINWKIKILLRGGKEGEDNIYIFDTFDFCSLDSAMSSLGFTFLSIFHTVDGLKAQGALLCNCLHYLNTFVLHVHFFKLQ